jgi:hypothetical protein
MGTPSTSDVCVSGPVVVSAGGGGAGMPRPVVSFSSGRNPWTPSTDIFVEASSFIGTNVILDLASPIVGNSSTRVSRKKPATADMCCCGDAKCVVSVSSAHSCSITSKRVNAWCYDKRQNAEKVNVFGSCAVCSGCGGKSDFNPTLLVM